VTNPRAPSLSGLSSHLSYVSLSYNLHPDPSGITLTPSAA